MIVLHFVWESLSIHSRFLVLQLTGMSIIKQNPNIIKEELAKQINITFDGVKYHIRKLRKKKVIKWVGPSKGGHWEIIEKS